ncbi:MAG: exosome complex RNA-binding protein Rrp4 [Candidatus Thorarchaeota archaeon]
MSVFFEKNQLVLPGDKLATGNYRPGQGVYREKTNEGNNYFSAFIGLASLRGNVISITPLEGPYVPLENDIVIGIITAVGIKSWMVDIGSPYPAILSVSNVLDRNGSSGGAYTDLSRFLQEGDLILAKIVSYDRTRDPALTLHQRGLKKLVSGRLVQVAPVKIPRIIGKQGSMISLIKDMTKSQIYVGQNGRILINSPDFETECFIIQILEKIQNEAHISGLTDRIKEMLKEHNKN